MLLARALQMFMPGKPQVWYLDLLEGKNDHEAVKRAGFGGHKEINRTNLTREEVESALSKDSVKKQLELIRFRSTFGAFGEGAEISVKESEGTLWIRWENQGCFAELTADFVRGSYEVNHN